MGCGKECTVGNMAELARLYYDTDRLALCEKQCKAILEVEIDCYWARTELGIIYSQTERCLEAIEVVKPVLGNGAFYESSAYYVMAVAHEYLDQYDEAETICKKALSLHTNANGEALWCTLLRVYTKTENAKAALETVKEIFARFQKDAYTLYCIFLAVQKFEPADVTPEDIIKMLQNLNQEREYVYFCQGLMVEKAGQLDEAYTLYRRARAENIMLLDLQKHVTEFEEKYPDVVQQVNT